MNAVERTIKRLHDQSWESVCEAARHDAVCGGRKTLHTDLLRLRGAVLDLGAELLTTVYGLARRGPWG